MRKGRQSKNIEDRRPSKTGKAGRLISEPDQATYMNAISDLIEARKGKPRVTPLGNKVGAGAMEKAAKKDSAEVAKKKYGGLFKRRGS